MGNCGKIGTLQSDHEEACSRMFVHCAYIASENNRSKEQSSDHQIQMLLYHVAIISVHWALKTSGSVQGLGNADS